MDSFGGNGGLEGIQTIGIVNSLKTGNVLIDMTVAMLIPVIIGFAISSATTIQKQICEADWASLFRKKVEYYERKISHSTVQSEWRTTDLGSGDTQNELLIKAIQLYLDHKGLLKLKSAELDLKQVGEEKKNDYYYYSEPNTTTVADTLSKYKVVKKPLKNVWLDLGKFWQDFSTHESLLELLQCTSLKS